MTITPDTKDWTWVLERPCPECGFDTQGFPVEAVPGMIMANTAAWQAALDGAGDARARPEPSKWSPLEYACHVRDVFAVSVDRIQLALATDAEISPRHLSFLETGRARPSRVSRFAVFGGLAS